MCENENKISSKNNIDLNNENKKPLMVLTIEVGNNSCDKLMIYDIETREQETYDFCLKNKLDYSTMKEINNSINNIIKSNTLTSLKSNQKNITQQNINKPPISTSNNKIQQKILNNKTKNQNKHYTPLSINTRPSSTGSKSSFNKTKNIKENIKNAIFSAKKFSKTLEIKNNVQKNNKSLEIKDFPNSVGSSPKIELSKNMKEKIEPSIEQNFFSESEVIKENNAISNSCSIISDDNIINSMEKKITNKNIRKESVIINDDEKKNNNTLQKYFNTEQIEDIPEISTINKSQATKKSTKQSKILNPGKDLYEREIQYKEKQKLKIKTLKKNLEIDEAEEYTFAPKINNISKTEIEKRKQKKLEYANPEIIKNYKKYKEQKQADLKKKQEIEFKKIHPFQPALNNETHRRSMKNITNRFEKLYNDRIEYKTKSIKMQEQYDKQFTYKPKIIKNSSFMKINIPFNERLKTYSSRTKEKMSKIQQKYENERKSNEIFRPILNNNKINRLLKNQRDNKSSVDVFTKQYLYNIKYQQNKKQLVEKYYESQLKSPRCCTTTEEIINNKKEKVFKKIFLLLDGDEDGKISSLHMSIKNLPESLQKILEPIFKELNFENESLNEKEFIFVCNKFYDTLRFDEKRELTNFEDIKKIKNNNSFRTKINKSKKISLDNKKKFRNSYCQSNRTRNDVIKLQKDKNDMKEIFLNKYYTNLEKNKSIKRDSNQEDKDTKINDET